MERFKKFVSKRSIRRLLLILMTVCAIIGTVSSALGTYSTDYVIERISFDNSTYYQKTEQYGDTYLEETYGEEFAGISLIPNDNRIFDINGYCLTPTGHPKGTKFPTIIWSHGMIANNEIQLHYAMELAAAGFKVIAVGLEGHGSNGGSWDLGITDHQVFYSAVEYALTLDDVNKSAIGVSGHSNGGYAAARAGLFDNSPLGTGGYIKAVGSIWCISDFNETLQELCGANPVNDPDYSWLIPIFMGTNNPTGTITEQDILRRSVSHYVNSTNIPNWLLVSGTKDQFSSAEIMYHVMSNATGKTKDFLKSAIASDPQESWNNTLEPQVSFTNGTARKLVIETGLDHIFEAFYPRMPQELIDWFVVSLDLDPNEYVSRMEQGTPVMVYWLLRFGGMIFLILAFLMSQLVVVAYLAPVMFPERRLKAMILKDKKREEQTVAELNVGYLTPGLQEFILDIEFEKRRDLFQIFRGNWKKKALFWVVLFGVMTVALVIFWRFNQVFRAVTRFWVFNAYLWQFLIMGVFVWILALVVLFGYKRSNKYGKYVNLRTVGASWEGFWKGFVFPFIVVFAPMMVYNIIAYSTALPIFWPRPAEPGVWTEVLVGSLMIWTLYLPLEVLVKTQLFPVFTKFKTKRGYWMEILINAGLVLFIWLAAYGVASLLMHPKLVNLMFGGTWGGFMFIFIVSMKPIINGVITFITAFIYQRTHDIWACSFYPVFIWFMIIFAKWVGIYCFY
ncbi:MAG: hypothetical protein GF364_15485 [Candidatus Lokiarchaeota archaeon]|nr:hypothetical protein [Candidatus Lokiarchaeota archaeon]